MDVEFIVAPLALSVAKLRRPLQNAGTFWIFDGFCAWFKGFQHIGDGAVIGGTCCVGAVDFGADIASAGTERNGELFADVDRKLDNRGSLACKMHGRSADNEEKTTDKDDDLRQGDGAVGENDRPFELCHFHGLVWGGGDGYDGAFFKLPAVFAVKLDAAAKGGEVLFDAAHAHSILGFVGNGAGSVVDFEEQ